MRIGGIAACRRRPAIASAPAGAGGMQDVEPRAVAVVDLEAEIGGRADHLDVDVDDRDVDAARQQRLAGDLAEAAEADDQHAAAQAVGDLDAVERLLVGGGRSGRSAITSSGVSAIERMTIAVSDRVACARRRCRRRRPRHRARRRTRRPAPEQRARVERLARGRAGQPRDDVDAERLDDHVARRTPTTIERQFAAIDR